MSSSEKPRGGTRSPTLTRARLLESGQALFAEKGLHKITTHDIAAHAGVAAGTFYNHFPDKSALFREITNEALSELTRRLDEASPSGAARRDTVHPQAEALISFAEDHREWIRILFSRESGAAAVEADVLLELANRIAETRRQSIATGEMPAEIDADVLAQALVGMWTRVVTWWAEDPNRLPRDRVIGTLTRIQLQGSHPRPEGA